LEGRLIYISVGELRPSPEQPRRAFGDLEALAESIRRCGVICPLTVRREGDGWQLVAGERRLRAARMAGLETVPCVEAGFAGREAAIAALVENLQREELNFAEQARGFRRLIESHGLTQAEAARRLGLSQSAVANKLRLLRLSPRLLDAALEAGLTERHARALLRLDGEAERAAALEAMARESMTAARAEAYVASLTAPKRPRKPRVVVRDLRIFYNTVSRGVELLRSGGVEASVSREESPEAVVVTVRIPKKRG
jgi:ParB family chromosome partitioning protein